MAGALHLRATRGNHADAAQVHLHLIVSVAKPPIPPPPFLLVPAPGLPIFAAPATATNQENFLVQNISRRSHSAAVSGIFVAKSRVKIIVGHNGS